jgi:hypothetical protein
MPARNGAANVVRLDEGDDCATYVMTVIEVTGGSWRG